MTNAHCRNGTDPPQQSGCGRRAFIGATLSTAALGPRLFAAPDSSQRQVPLAGEIGITTGSFTKHLSAEPRPGKLCLVDLPRIMRDELDMRVIDLMTATLASLEPAYLDRLRNAADQWGCVLTNLKMNLTGCDLAAVDPALRSQSLDRYRNTLDAAARLGVRWARPAPEKERPNLEILASSYRELMDYAAPKGIRLLVENNGWMRGDPDSIPDVIGAVGGNLAASPDTGNWSSNEVRYAGLARAFPLAVTCDFKAFTLGPNGEHADYDLKRCFEIGWKSGFRGPWCLEHFHAQLPALFREMGLLRDLLRQWMKAAG